MFSTIRSKTAGAYSITFSEALLNNDVTNAVIGVASVTPIAIPEIVPITETTSGFLVQSQDRSYKSNLAFVPLIFVRLRSQK